MQKISRRLLLVIAIAFHGFRGDNALAQADTIRVMAYNVLNYGQYPLCQGPNSVYHAYLQAIVGFANPDIIGLEKMGSIKTSSSDFHYTAAVGFHDSILQYALNAAFPGRYACCPFTNNAASQTECLLFYDQQKLGFADITLSYTNTEDFNTYKLYYKDPNLATTHDTTYLYVTVNHDISGDGNEAARGVQIAGEMAQIGARFTHLANMVNMGDFNVRYSTEPCYQTLTAPADTNFRYYDPPFYPDASLAYPANWDASPSPYASYLTTSTRSSGSIPNSCGTSGGGKDWYDHIFLSPWIVNNANYISYVPNSFRVIGNDGHRIGVSVNALPANTAAPSAVTDALFQMSNKYPVMVDLAVTQNTTGSSLPDPEKAASAVANINLQSEHITIVNPVSEQLTLHLSSGLMGQVVYVECSDMLGRLQINEPVWVNSDLIQMPCGLKPGIYSVRITGKDGVICQSMIIKK